MRLPIPIPGFNGVGPGQPATSSLQVGPKFTYNAIKGTLLKDGVFVALADLATDVSEIRVEADGDVLRRITPALLLDYLQCKGLTGVLANGAAGGVASFVIPFADPSRRDVVGEEVTQLGTVGVKQLVLVVVLNDPGGAPVYTLTGEADVSVDQPKALAVFERWYIDTFNIINGTASFNTVPTDEDLFGILFHASTITRVRVTMDNEVVFDCYKADIESLLRLNGLGLATANYFPYVQDFSRQVTDRLMTSKRTDKNVVIARISDLTIEVTATAAATIKALRRTFDY